jgi:hypothetical protein
MAGDPEHGKAFHGKFGASMRGAGIDTLDKRWGCDAES